MDEAREGKHGTRCMGSSARKTGGQKYGAGKAGFKQCEVALKESVRIVYLHVAEIGGQRQATKQFYAGIAPADVTVGVKGKIRSLSFRAKRGLKGSGQWPT